MGKQTGRRVRQVVLFLSEAELGLLEEVRRLRGPESRADCVMSLVFDEAKRWEAQGYADLIVQALHALDVEDDHWRLYGRGGGPRPRVRNPKRAAPEPGSPSTPRD